MQDLVELQGVQDARAGYDRWVRIEFKAGSDSPKYWALVEGENWIESG